MDSNLAAFAAASRYSYTERIGTDDGAKTYRVTLLYGTHYRTLLAVDDEPLGPAEQMSERKRFLKAAEHRSKESAAERTRRIAGWEEDREQAHEVLEQMRDAFTYEVRSTRRAGSRTVYVVDALPRKGYRPPSLATEVLTGMQAELWIDTATFQLVKATARVLKPVSVLGFLARVQPGTEFEVERGPVDEEVWLPSRLEVHSRSSFVYLFQHQMSETRTYFDYQRISGVDGREPESPGVAHPRSEVH